MQSVFKVGDFGMSAPFDDEGKMKGRAGSLHYGAPVRLSRRRESKDVCGGLEGSVT